MTIKRPKDKGTAEETAIVRSWENRARVVRQPAGAPYDVHVTGSEFLRPIEVLSTRPDRGQRLYTLREEDFQYLWSLAHPSPPVHIESKRYAKFAHHAIFERKFGR